MKYKYNLGDRVIGIENTPLEETEEEEEEEDIIGKKGTIIGRMGGEEEHIYVVTFDEVINNYSCLYYGSKQNRTTFLYEHQFVKIND